MKRFSHFGLLFLRGGLAALMIAFVALAALFAFWNVLQTRQRETYLMEKQSKLQQMTDSIASELQMMERQQLRLLADSNVTKLVYSRDELNIYEYYRIINYITAQLREMKDDFRYVKDVHIRFGDMGIQLDADGPVQSLPLSLEEQKRARQEKLFLCDGRLYIVRSVMEYLETGMKELCCVMLEIDADRLYESYSFVCLEGESVSIRVGEDVVPPGTAGETSSSVSAASDAMRMSAVLAINSERYAVADSFLRSLVYGTTGLILALACYYAYYVVHRIYNPLRLLLVEAFSHLEKGDLEYRIPPRAGDEAFDSVYSTFNSAMSKLEDLVENVYQQKLLISEMNLKQLQAQINPHFMYNTYYTLYRLIQDGNHDSSQRLARLLGDFYRYITRTGQGEKRLLDEIQHTLTYVEIQAMRFDDTILEIEPLPKACEALPVPQLILQPVFENVFQHVQKNLQENEPLHLRMRYREDGDGLCILVENNGVLAPEVLAQLQRSLENIDGQAEMTGLLNIHKRLLLFYGEGFGLRVSQSDLGGLCVSIRIMR